MMQSDSSRAPHTAESGPCKNCGSAAGSAEAIASALREAPLKSLKWLPASLTKKRVMKVTLTLPYL